MREFCRAEVHVLGIEVWGLAASRRHAACRLRRPFQHLVDVSGIIDDQAAVDDRILEIKQHVLERPFGRVVLLAGRLRLPRHCHREHQQARADDCPCSTEEFLHRHCCFLP
jgi:hypothetical protein